MEKIKLKLYEVAIRDHAAGVDKNETELIYGPEFVLAKDHEAAKQKGLLDCFEESTVNLKKFDNYEVLSRAF